MKKFSLSNFKLRNLEPIFDSDKPKFELNFKFIIFVAIIAWIVGWISKNGDSGKVWAIIASLIIIIINIINFKSSTKRWNYKKYETQREWDIWNEKRQKEESDWNEEQNERKTEVARKWKVWDEMRKNPPILYHLMLETNAGTKPLFHSFNKEQIIKTRDAIKCSMEKKDVSSIAFNIDTINVGSEDSINNFGSEIYNQAINN